MDDICGFDYFGVDDIGADQVVTIPTVGATYDDAKTVTAVQYALMKRGYSLGDTGPNHDGVDGVFGPKTKKAIQKLQGNAGLEQTGKIDTQVLQALGNLTPGVLPPGVTAAGRAAVQAQVALDAATLAEHAVSPSDVQAAAQQAVDASQNAAPPLPPEVLQAARNALVKAKAATTPAQVQAVKEEVKAAAEDVHAAVKPSWWTSPAWPGGWPRWQVGTIAGGATVGLVALLAAVFKGGAKVAVGR